MKFSYPGIVRFSECGSAGQLTPAGIVTYMQDCSAMQSDFLGIGTKELLENKRAWFVIAWNIQIYEQPKVNTPIRTWTWSTSFKGIYGKRCMQLCNDVTGETYAECDALYVFMDLNTMHPTKVEGKLGLGYPIEPALPSVRPAGRKLPVLSLEAGAIQRESFVIRRHDADAYGHMNNAHYVSYADDYLPEDFKVYRLQVEYKLSARPGDTVNVLTKLSAGDLPGSRSVDSAENPAEDLVEKRAGGPADAPRHFEVEMQSKTGAVFARVLYSEKGANDD